MRSGIGPASSWILVGFINTEPKWELLFLDFIVRVSKYLPCTIYTSDEMSLKFHHKTVSKNNFMWSSLRGSVVNELTRIHEDAGSFPGLAQWVKDPALL